MPPTFRQSIGLPSGARATGCLIIGEVAQTHDGSLGLAHAFIDAIARAGADAVKFQTHIAAAESTPSEPWRVKFSRQDSSRYDYWKRMEFTEDQWKGLKAHAEEIGLLFLSSPFSTEAVLLLARLGLQAWKVASGEISNGPLLRAMLATGKPMLLSSGMSSITELDGAVSMMREAGVPFAVMQCTSMYPCPPERVGLDMLPQLRARFGCPVGLSDHSGTIYPGLASAMLECDVIEVHVALSREQFGPDVPASVTTTELAQLVDGVRFIEAMRSATTDKNAVAVELAPLRALFTKSVVVRRRLEAGHLIVSEDLAVKKPGTGIPPSRIPELVGRRLRHTVAPDTLLTDSDLEEVL